MTVGENWELGTNQSQPYLLNLQRCETGHSIGQYFGGLIQKKSTNESLQINSLHTK